MVFDAWKLKITCIFSNQEDLLDFRSHKVAFHASFVFLIEDNLHWRMVSPSSSFFLIHENASQKMYPTL
jgi:hypothetical protein